MSDPKTLAENLSLAVFDTRKAQERLDQAHARTDLTLKAWADRRIQYRNLRPSVVDTDITATQRLARVDEMRDRALALEEAHQEALNARAEQGTAETELAKAQVAQEAAQKALLEVFPEVLASLSPLDESPPGVQSLEYGVYVYVIEGCTEDAVLQVSCAATVGQTGVQADTPREALLQVLQGLNPEETAEISAGSLAYVKDLGETTNFRIEGETRHVWDIVAG